MSDQENDIIIAINWQLAIKTKLLTLQFLCFAIHYIAAVSLCSLFAVLLQIISDNLGADEVLFGNNLVESLVQEAVCINVSDVASIINNTFEHVRKQSFTAIQPKTQMSKLKIGNNDFHNFEPGFLELNSEWASSKRGEIFEKINLQIPCDCSLDRILDPQHSNNYETENNLLEHSYCSSNSGFSHYISLSKSKNNLGYRWLKK